METTAREFTRNFRQLRAVAARGRIVRVTAPEGVYVFSRQKAHKTCGSVLAALAPLRGRGFLTTGQTLVTRNVKHFRKIRGLQVLAH